MDTWIHRNPFIHLHSGDKNIPKSWFFECSLKCPCEDAKLISNRQTRTQCHCLYSGFQVRTILRKSTNSACFFLCCDRHSGGSCACSTSSHQHAECVLSGTSSTCFPIHRTALQKTPCPYEPWSKSSLEAPLTHLVSVCRSANVWRSSPGEIGSTGTDIWIAVPSVPASHRWRYTLFESRYFPATRCLQRNLQSALFGRWISTRRYVH